MTHSLFSVSDLERGGRCRWSTLLPLYNLYLDHPPDPSQFSLNSLEKISYDGGVGGYSGRDAGFEVAEATK